MKVMAAENERRHLSRELHDEFLQFLVAFKIRGKLLADEPDREERERAWAVIADEILNAIRGVKRMIRGLRSPKLEQQGLVSALATLFRDARRVHGVTIHASLSLEWVADELDPVTVLALYRIVQEAVTNAATHAKVGEAAVTLRSTRHITGLGLETRVLVLTIHDEDEFLIPALDAGAAGFLNKSVADTDLMGAIEAIVRGHSYLPRRATALLARRKAEGTSSRRPGTEVLSSRERTAIELYARGFSTSEAAEEMFLSPKTVEGYIGRAKTKLGLRTRRDIVRFALDAGLLQAEGEQ